MADKLLFICTNGCGVCGVKLRDFVTHATQAQDDDQWVTVASEPEIVSTCCGSPVDVWDERKQDVVAEVRALSPTASAPAAPIDKSELKRLVSLVFGDDFQIVRKGETNER